jgi:hypothetical protein
MVENDYELVLIIILEEWLATMAICRDKAHSKIYLKYIIYLLIL